MLLAQVFDLDTFAPVYIIGREGTGQTEFRRVTGVCVDPNTELLYVGDSFNHRVSVFSGALRDGGGVDGGGPQGCVLFCVSCIRFATRCAFCLHASRRCLSFSRWSSPTPHHVALTFSFSVSLSPLFFVPLCHALSLSLSLSRCAFSARDGSWFGSIGHEGKGKGEFHHVRDIAIDADAGTTAFP